MKRKRRREEAPRIYCGSKDHRRGNLGRSPVAAATGALWAYWRSLEIGNGIWKRRQKSTLRVRSDAWTWFLDGSLGFFVN